MGDDDVELEDDDRSVNSELARAAEQTAKLAEDKEVHHFVIVLDTWRGKNSWTRAIQRAKKLSCCVCQKNDDVPGVLSFPVQCSAAAACTNTTNKGRQQGNKRARAEKTDNCPAVMHVGCAIWNPNLSQTSDRQLSQRQQQVFFFPGKPGTTESEPVANIYCSHHAQEVVDLENKYQQSIPTAKSRLLDKPSSESVDETQPVASSSPSSLSSLPANPAHGSQRIQQSALITKRDPNSSRGLVVEWAPPIQPGGIETTRVVHDWSKLVVGKDYDDEYWDNQVQWDLEATVDPKDIIDN